MTPKLNYRFVIILLFVYVSFSFVAPTGNERVIGDFKLKNVNNKMIALSDYTDAQGFIVVFMSNKCPMAKLYTQRLNGLKSRYEKQKVYVLAINSMDTLAYQEETFRLMQKKALNDKMQVPYLQDKKQKVAKQFQASHTPEVFVIWKGSQHHFRIRYQGCIDDNASEPSKATPFLINAMEELLHGKAVSKPVTESFGCRIFYRGEKPKMN